LLEGRAEFSGLVEFEPVDRALPLLSMKFELEAIFEQRENELLKLLRSLNFGVISGDGVDVEALIIYPARRAGHTVIVNTRGDANEGADSSGGSDEASTGQDAPVGGIVAGEPVWTNGRNLELKG